MIELKVFNGMFYASHNDRLLPIKSRLYPSGQVTLNELKVDSKLDEGYFPLGFIEISSFSNFRFLPFVLLSEKKILFVLWRLDKNFSYLSQIKISQAELKLLFRLNVNEDNINQPISCLNLDLGSHVLAIRNKLVPKRNIDEYRFSDEYYNSGYDRASSALDFVFDGVDCNNWKELENNLLNFYNQNEKDNAKVNKTLTKWENLCALGLPKEDKFIPGTVSMFRYDYLRELLAIEYRKDVLYNPITRSHQFCASSRFFFVNGSKERLGKFCVSYYKDIPLVEFRAGGWSCSTFAYQFGDYFTWELRKSHVTWPIDSNKLVTRHAETLNQSLNTPCISPSQKSLVLNSSTQSNLGHFLWNDLSGIHNASQCLDPEFVEMGCIDIGKKGFSGTEGYQSFAIRASLYPKNTKIYDKNSILELTLHTNPIIIKSLVFSPDLASTIKKNSSKLILPKILEDEYCILKSPHLIKILFNIRVHNKSWLNISECLDHFFASASDFIDLNKLCFVFDYPANSSETVDTLVEKCVKHKVFTCRVQDASVENMSYVTDHVDAAVVAVGSGLILPTWVYGKKVIAHGDPGHMSQLRWWFTVCERSTNVKDVSYAFESNDIKPISEKFYSNYNINCSAFSTALIDLISEIVNLKRGCK